VIGITIRAVQPRFVTFLCATAIFVPSLLLLDGAGLAHQLLLGALTAAFLAYFAWHSGAEPLPIVIAIAVATLGETILSIGWGLYDYRHALIPLYVPPGHGVFYLLAAESARQPLLRRHAVSIERTVLIGGSAMALVSLALLNDVWGLVWWIAAVALLRRSSNRLLLSTCIVFTVALEWLGTSLGNWRWAAEVPLLGIPSANPPSGVGILYVLLDLIVLAICVKLPRSSDEWSGAATGIGERAAARAAAIDGGR
jgi:hypothetical protein